MTTDPQQIRAQIDALLVELPRLDPEAPETLFAHDADVETVGRRLEEAHQILVNALESVEKG